MPKATSSGASYINEDGNLVTVDVTGVHLAVTDDTETPEPDDEVEVEESEQDEKVEKVEKVEEKDAPEPKPEPDGSTVIPATENPGVV